MTRSIRLRLLTGAFLLVLALVLAGCGGGGGQKGQGKGGQEQLAIEGSSTVLPITQAAAEAFNRENPNVDITVGGAGTGDGIEAFCNGDIPIADASRPIKPEEADTCQQNGVEFMSSRWPGTASRSWSTLRTNSRRT